MSRLTASPFHKPSPYELSLIRPLSPPETSSDYAQRTSESVPITTSLGADLDFDTLEGLSSAPIIPSDMPGSRFRRTSSLTYNNSSLRDRSSSRSKPLIVVIPPLALHGQLGQTLSSGPLRRLSQGILMPLFPTMYAQLTAIAREFNFPSTTGLCLYLHYSDGGTMATPRISDDAWPSIWGSALELPSHPTAGSTTPPFNINGRIEFDIDLHRARWYTAWLSSRRGGVDIPSLPQSISHFRLDSGTTNTEEPAVETRSDNVSAVRQQNSSVGNSTQRHAPKKLSLVDRFDIAPAPTQAEPHALSPIVQEDEPKTAKRDLKRRVNSWIAGASFRPSPHASKGQTTLEPANTPDTPSPGVLPEEAYNSELNLDEFTWSVSSPGPSIDKIRSASSSQFCLPSVHLANRMEGSVDLTPSACSSFGPHDYKIPSPMSPSFRSPFLDLGQRIVEDVPITPTTATTWGPTSWPGSPFHMNIARSVNLGERGDRSLPATPSTATSWGAPLSYPPSPRTLYHIPTPDLGQRVFDFSPTATVSTTAPSRQVWPYRKGRSQDEDKGEIPSTDGQLVDNRRLLSPQYLRVTFPKHRAKKGRPWALVWPYLHRQPKEQEKRDASRARPYDMRNSVPWTQVWPYSQRRLKDEGEGETSKDVRDWPLPLSSSSLCGYPHFNLYFVHDSYQTNKPSLIDVKLDARYPVFDLYPAVYPNIVPYPPKPEGTPTQSTQYPDFNLDPIVATHPLQHYNTTFAYPDLKIHPASNSSAGSSTTPLPSSGSSRSDSNIYPDLPGDRNPAAYPLLNLYSAVYPHFELYPEVPSSQPETSVVDRSDGSVGPAYPHFELYPASSSRAATGRGPVSSDLSVYPHFELYPEVWSSQPETLVVDRSDDSVEPAYPHFELYPTSSNRATTECGPVSSDLYSAVYPHFELYPEVLSSELETSLAGRFVPDSVGPAYPHFDLYPASPHGAATERRPVSFDIYPAVYPHFELYPDVHSTALDEICVEAYSTAPSPIGNAYPHFELYPASSKMVVEDRKPVSMEALASYPAFDLYPFVYPYFGLYPRPPCKVEEKLTVDPSRVPMNHPPLEPASTGPPEFNAHHTSTRIEEATTSIMVKLPASYPVFDLYPPVYPNLDLWPSVTKLGSDDVFMPARLTASYPTFDLYPPVYPYFELWPSLPTTESQLNDPRIGEVEMAPQSRRDSCLTMSSDDGTAPPVNATNSKRKPSRSHIDLHLSVFPDGNVITPSGAISQTNSAEFEPREHLRVKALSHKLSAAELGMSGARSRSGSVSVRPPLDASSKIKKLPVIPGNSPSRQHSPSPPSEGKPPLRRLPPTPSNPRRPRDLPNIPDAESAVKQSDTPASSQVEKYHSPSPSLLKIATTQGSSPHPSETPVESPERRNSLVRNRIKAYNSNTPPPRDLEPINLPDALARFPMPPPSSVPLMPPVSRVDRSKSAFA